MEWEVECQEWECQEWECQEWEAWVCQVCKAWWVVIKMTKKDKEILMILKNRKKLKSLLKNNDTSILIHLFNMYLLIINLFLCHLKFSLIWIMIKLNRIQLESFLFSLFSVFFTFTSWGFIGSFFLFSFSFCLLSSFFLFHDLFVLFNSFSIHLNGGMTATTIISVPMLSHKDSWSTWWASFSVLGNITFS